MNSPSETPPTSPTRIGNRYRLEERIGAGAMGAVWRGTDELLNRPVALKELLAAAVRGPGPDGVEEARQRLMREGRIGARLQHPHVISMFDVVVHDDRPWLVMEYLPSLSLAQVLSQKGPLEPREAADVGRQVADGLSAAHLAGVVHRDVKPGNVLLAEDGRVKLTDFGVSRAVDDVQLTRTGLIAGTPAFLAPEVARGKEPTAASDVFALGATLYAAVEGTPPFGLDDNAYALLHKVATGVVEPPTQAGPLGPVIMTLLAAEPADRPTAAQARDALQLVADGRAPDRTLVAAVPPRRPPADPGPATVGAAPPPRPAGRRRTLSLVVAAVALVVVVGGGVLAAVLVNGRGATPPAGLPTTGSPQTPADVPPSSVPGSADPPTSAPTTTTSAPPTTTAVPTSTATPPDDPAAFVRAYYALLPDDTDAAFAMLGPAAQQASGGQEGYENFYAGIESVSLRDVEAVDDSTVDATVVFDPIDGDTTEEPYRFVIGTDGGRTVIESFSR